MILQKLIGGNIKHLLGGVTPPASIDYQLKTDGAVSLGAAPSVDAPLAATVASQARKGAGSEWDLTTDLDEGDELDPSITAGAAVRVVDAKGRAQDVLCTGVDADGVIGVDGLTLEAGDEVVSVWCPEVALPVSGELLTECGDIYALHVTVTAEDDSISRDIVPFAVCNYHLQMPLTVRTYLDHHTDLWYMLSTFSRRKDWSRLCDSARSRLEDRIRASRIWLDCTFAASGIQRALAASLHSILAPGNIPEKYASIPGEYEDRAEKKFEAAVGELLAGAKVDNNQDGVVTEEDRTEFCGITRLRL